MDNKEFVKKIYLSSVEGPNKRERPLGRWEDRVEEYLSERGVRGNCLEWARRKCKGWVRLKSVRRGHPLGERSQSELTLELFIDVLKTIVFTELDITNLLG